MAVASLTRMTVPLASDQSNPNQGLLMPKLKYRFRVIFENFGVSTPRTELTKQISTAARPTVSFEEIKVPIYNSTLKLAGKHTWNDVEIKLRDDAGGNVQKLVGEQLQKQLDFYEQASAAAGIDYKFITKIEILDGGNGSVQPTVLDTWELYGCYLKSAAYDTLDYAANEAVMITITVTYDNALQTPLGTGVGTEVARLAGDVITGAGVR